MQFESRAPRVARHAVLLAVVMVGTVLAPRVSAAQADKSVDACYGDSTTAGRLPVRGRVVRAGTLAPVPSAQVVVGWNVLVAKGMAVRTVRCERPVTADAQGRFTVDSMPDDESLIALATGASGEVGVAVRMQAGNTELNPVTVYMPSESDAAAAPVPASGKACTTLGRVLTVRGTPVANARVRVEDADVVRTDAGGAFSAPVCGRDGTSFDIRGLDVTRGQWWVSTAGTPTVWAISLDRPVPRLDAVVVSAPRNEYRDITGFEDRRKGGFGKFVTREDIAQRNPIRVAFMLEGMPGVQVSNNGSTVAMGRSTAAGRSALMPCQAAVYLDGMWVPGFDLAMMDPQSVMGIEVYRGAAETPPQFIPVRGGGCGAVVIWTRRGP
jgi:hypothetical protein